MKNTSSNNVQSLERALTLLEALAETREGYGLKMLSEETGLNKSTVHRLLHTMMDFGFIYQDSETERYSLGTKILYLSNSLIDSMDVRTIAAPYLKELCKITGETVHLLIMQGASAVYIDKVENPHRAIRMYSRVGKSIPLYSSSGGKVLLAWLSEQKIRRILGPGPFKTFTKNTIGDMDALLAQLFTVRKHGFAVDWFEHEAWIFCIAAPIFDSQNNAVAAVSMAGTPLEFNPDNFDDFCLKINHTAQMISERLGCNSYPAFFRPMEEDVRSVFQHFSEKE